MIPDRKALAIFAPAGYGKSTLVAHWKQQFFTKNEAYNSLLDSLEHNFPAYYDLKYQSYVATISDIQNDILNAEDTLIEYYMDDSSMYILTLTKESTDLHVLQHDSSFALQIDDFRKSILNRDKTNYIFEYEEAELIGEFIGYYNRNPIAAGFAYEQRELSKSVLDLLMNGIY